MSVDIANQTDTVTEKVENLSLDDDTTKTVLRSQEDFDTIHPLTHNWTLWYTKPPVGKEDWHSLLKEIVTVSTVEEFWGAYNSIPKVSSLQLRSDYSFFKKGVKPEWEDSANQKGGRWAYQFRDSKHQNTGSITVDEAWLRMLLGIIGGTLDAEPEIVTGAFVNVRKAGIRVLIWTSTVNDEEALKKVGERFKNALKLGPNEKVEFKSHKEANDRRSSSPKYVV